MTRFEEEALTGAREQTGSRHICTVHIAGMIATGYFVASWSLWVLGSLGNQQRAEKRLTRNRGPQPETHLNSYWVCDPVHEMYNMQKSID